MDFRTFIFIGRSGSGKGTQAKLLIEYLEKQNAGQKVFYLETGERLREFVKRDNYTSKLARKIMEEGGLQPEFLAIHMWAHLFIENITGAEHLVIDGTPRYLNETKVLDTALRFYGFRKPEVIYIDVSEDWARGRLTSRGRSDDQEKEALERRLAWFKGSVIESVEFFRNNPDYRFHQINGEQTVGEVQREILSKLKI